MHYFFTAEGEFESVFTGMIPVKCEGLWNLGLLACVTHTFWSSKWSAVSGGWGGGLCNLLSKYDAISAKTENHSV